MLLIFGMGVVMAALGLLDRTPQAIGWWWPVITIGFTAGGLFGLFHALNQEAVVLSVISPGSIAIERGKAFQRERRWADRASFRIKDTKDNDGVNVFELWMDAPGGPLCIAEGYSRRKLERLQQQLEDAISGR